MTQRAMTLSIALPEGTRFVAQDADGAYHAYDDMPTYHADIGEWINDHLSAHIGWGLPVPYPERTLRGVGS